MKRSRLLIDPKFRLIKNCNSSLNNNCLINHFTINLRKKKNYSKTFSKEKTNKKNKCLKYLYQSIELIGKILPKSKY